MPWPTDDLSTVNLDEVSDNPVASLPEIYAAVQKLQAVLAELTAGDTVLSAENAASNGIARTDNNNNFSVRQVINHTSGNAGPLYINTTAANWLNVIDFVRGGDIDRGFRIAHDDTANYFQLSVANQASIRVDHGSQILRLLNGDLQYNNTSIINNAKPKGAYDSAEFTDLTTSNKTGASIAWTPTGDYNRVMVMATVQTQGNNDGSYSTTADIYRGSTLIKSNTFWTAEDQEGTVTLSTWSTSTGAATWQVRVRRIDGPITPSITVKTTLAIWEVNT